MTLHLSRAASPDGTWYKYDPVDDIWYDCSAYTEITDDRKRIYLTLKDGGFGDADGIENGIIVDPLGLSVPSSPHAAADVADEGDGGCFISATVKDHKTYSPEVVGYQSSRRAMALMLLLLLIKLGQIRRSRSCILGSRG